MNVLITGGASGLGLALTRKMAEENGNSVYFTYSSSATNAVALESEFPNVHAFRCDFTNAASVHELKEKIAGWDIDVLINNAYTGEAVKAHFNKIPTADFLADFSNNIMPVVTITQAAISHFRKKKRGKIITILTSYLVNTPPVGTSVYVASKAYLAALVKAWATENARFNITSNAVSPGLMQTAMTAGVDERIMEQLIDAHPYKRLLTVQEVADTVSFLATASSQINGMDLTMNAGVNIR